ncbi:GerAB/ArcD/ProY family transporter [Sporosalibacterium faouarense]|uniref:GerAB/ArcD/ProY family transporter n=1 Tax=Sporosalibacterium faouarense TaxID=516123 RepID=UPI00192C46AF|nr:GerAB/ArcD/ProY family transporter [Sporosalibacterium faouarense]
MNVKRINIFQIRAILITVTTGIGLITLPRVLAKETSTTSWLPMLLGLILILIISYFILKLLNHFPNSDIYEISKNVLGKYISIIVCLLFISYFILVSSSTVRFTTDVVNIWMLPLTPMKVIILTLLTIASYICFKKIETLGRFCTVFLIFNVLSVVLVLFFTFPSLKEYNLRPFFHTNLSHLFRSTKASLLSLLGIETLFIFNKFISDKINIKPTIYKSIIFIGLLYVLLVEFTIGYFGIDQVKVLVFPVISLFKTIEIRFFIFERVELFFLTLWLTAAFTTISIYYYCGFYLLTKILPKRLSRLVLPFYLVITYLLAQYPQNNEDTIKLLNLAGNTGIILSTSITLLLLIIIKLRGANK